MSDYHLQRIGSALWFIGWAIVLFAMVECTGGLR